VDGTDLRNITNTPDEERDPAWSPDGRSIAFTGKDSIYIMNADGTNQRKLAAGSKPKWSPDGKFIVYSVSSDEGRNYPSDIYIMNADGTNVRKLTNSPTKDESYPTWES
jgi:TolB protein